MFGNPTKSILDSVNGSVLGKGVIVVEGREAEIINEYRRGAEFPLVVRRGTRLEGEMVTIEGIREKGNIVEVDVSFYGGELDAGEYTYILRRDHGRLETIRVVGDSQS